MKNECPFFPNAQVVAYLRDSGHEEQELSIEQQEAELKKFCAQNFLILTKVFKDEARKGSTMVGRQQFQEMIRHFREGAKDKGVIIWKFSRFARDQDDSQFYKADLRRRGYIVHAMMDKIPTGPEGRFFEAALDWMNQKFLEDLSSDVKRGLRHLVEQYQCVPGVPPRGIKRTPVVIGKRRDGREHIAHRWDPDPEWIGRVQRAFELKAQGISLEVIRQETGLYRSINSYKTFFTNKIWLGILEFGEDLVIENYCKPVISKELWDLVQVRLEEHSQKQHVHSKRLHPQRKNSRYLLSGLLLCPRCGGAMSGFPSKNGYGKQYDRYGCGNAKRNKGCDMPALPRYGLEMAVISEMVEHVLQEEVMTRLLNEIQADAAGLQEAVTTEQDEYTRRLVGVKKALENISRAIEARGHSEALLDRLIVLETDKAELQARLDTLAQKAQIALPDETEDELHVTAQELRLILREGSDEERRDILRGLVEKIMVDKWGKMMVGNIWFYFPPERRFPPENKNALIDENQGESVDIERRSRRVSNPRSRP